MTRWGILIGFIIACAISFCGYLVYNYYKYSNKKIPNPAIKKIEDAFGIVKIRSCYSCNTGVIYFKTAKQFIEYTKERGEATRVFVWNCGCNHVQYFWIAEGHKWRFAIELPMEVKKK